MPTLYVTSEEFAALGADEISAIKAAGEQVVVVEDDAAAERAGWADAKKQKRAEHVPDVQVSFMPVTEPKKYASSEDQTDPEPVRHDTQTALLSELVDLQRQTLSEMRALRSELAKFPASIPGLPFAMETPTRAYVPVDTSISNIDFSPLDEAIKNAYQEAVVEDASETIKSMIEALDAEIAKARDEGGSG